MLLQCHHSRACRKTHKPRTQAQRVFKTAPLYAVTNPEEAAPQSVLDAFAAFFESLWSPSTNPDGSTVQKAGMSYVYDEDGTLIAQTLTGGAQSSWGQSARYVYLPTASGPMPVAAIYGTKHYAIQSDHLNTPRRLIQSDGQVAWQWAYSAFGEEKPTIAKNRFANTELNQSFGTTAVPAVTFNLRYPGQYFDQESNLHYNYHRSYSATTGRYTQSDPIGLDGGWNRFRYAEQNPMSNIDPEGLAVGVGVRIGAAAMAICMKNKRCKEYAEQAIKECKEIECKFERHDAHHKFPLLGYCEHYSLTSYKKGVKNDNFRLQWAFPGRCVSDRPNKPLPDWLK